MFCDSLSPTQSDQSDRMSINIQSLNFSINRIYFNINVTLRILKSKRPRNRRPPEIQVTFCGCNSHSSPTPILQRILDPYGCFINVPLRQRLSPRHLPNPHRRLSVIHLTYGPFVLNSLVTMVRSRRVDVVVVVHSLRL